MRQPLWLPDAQRLIWNALDQHPGRRPTMAEIARAVGMSELELRRVQQRHHAARVRDFITYGCLTYAARFIAQGEKVEWAMTRSGFHNRTNFCHEFRQFLGCQPHEFRGFKYELLVAEPTAKET
jgi:AraC-like DNA-binding protein